jgi:hypothetical protein
MCKKIFLILAMLIFVVSNLFSQTELSKTYRVVNNSANDLITNVSVSTIVPNQARILSFSICQVAGQTNAVQVGLYDEASGTTHSNNNLIGEKTAPANASTDKIFPYPKNLSNGLTIYQSPYSIVIVEYTK